MPYFLGYLSLRVGQVRIRNKINLGDGGNEEMLKAIRTQGNYIEYAPAALLGLVLLAMLGVGTTVLHILGAVFFFARVAHLLGLGVGVWPTGRLVGTLLTMITLLVTGGFLIYKALI